MRFVYHLNCLGSKDRLMSTPVVATEEQVNSAGEHDSNIRLGGAPIASVRRTECRRSHRGCHEREHLRCRPRSSCW